MSQETIDRWLRQLPNGKYKVKFKLNGEWFQKTLQTTDLKEARKLRDEYRNEVETKLISEEATGGLLGQIMSKLDSTAPAPVESPLLSDYYHVVNRKYWSKGRDEQGIKTRIWKFIELVGDLPLHEITTEIVSDYKDKLNEAGYKVGTINRHLANLRFLLNKAKFLKVIKEVPDFEMESEKGTERTFVYSKAEITQILDYFAQMEGEAGARMFHFIKLAAFTGIRRGDILAWETSHVVETDGGLAVRFKMSKAQNHTTLPLHKEAQESVRALVELNKISETYSERFHGLSRYQNETYGTYKRPTPPNKMTKKLVKLTVGQVDHYWKKMRDSLGWHSHDGRTIHAFRHSVVTLLLTKGVPATHVQKLVGHASIATTQKYEHMIATQLKGSLDQLDW